MVGRVGFHASPDANGVIEIGYEIERATGVRDTGSSGNAADPLRRAARLRLGYPSVDRPRNEPSLRMAERLGFRRIGEQIDEIDGLEYVFEREAPPGRGG